MKNFLFWISRKLNFPFVAPSVLQVSLTYGCNLRCKMCQIVDLLPSSEELSTLQVIRVLSEAKDYGIKEVVLTGGEPLLREDIFDICAECSSLGLRSIVTTNGLLVDEAVADKIVRARINHVHISLEGLQEAHDFFRGQGSFKKVIQTVGILNNKRAAGNSFSIGLACTVMQNNVQDLFDVVKLADDIGVDVINFQPFVNDNANFKDKVLSKFWVKGEGINILRNQITQIRAHVFSHVQIYEEPQMELLIKYYQGTLSRKDWICFGGFKTVFVCYSKKEPLVYSCHGICGNLNKMTLKQAWESNEAHNLRVHSMKCRDLCMQSCYSLKDVHDGSFLKLFGIGHKNGY